MVNVHMKTKEKQSAELWSHVTISASPVPVSPTRAAWYVHLSRFFADMFKCHQSIHVTGFVNFGLHVYVWLAVKHELHNQVHMWKGLCGGQLLSLCHDGASNMNMSEPLPFIMESFLQLGPHDLNAAWKLFKHYYAEGHPALLRCIQGGWGRSFPAVLKSLCLWFSRSLGALRWS